MIGIPSGFHDRRFDLPLQEILVPFIDENLR